MTDSEEKSTISSVVVPTGRGRERARTRWVTVEPIIALGMMGYTCLSLVKPLYVKDIVSELNNFNETDNSSVKCGVHTTDKGLYDKVQAESSMWLLYLGAASSFPGMLSNIIFSSASDRLGRKLAISLPIVGFIIQVTVYFVTVQFRLPLPVLFVGEVFQGLCGGFGLLFAGCISYITDATTVKQRTLRIVVAEMLTFLIGGLNQIGIGYLEQGYGYLPPLEIALGCNVIALIYAMVPPFLIETIDRGSIHRKGFREVGLSMKKLLVFNENGRRWQMLLLDFFIFFLVSQFTGVTSIFVLYATARPFCMTPSLVGIASAMTLVLGSVGMIVGTKLFSFCLGDYWLMQISCLSMVVSLLVMGLAQSTLVFFIGIVLGCLRVMSIPVARSVLSKIVHADETGAMFSIVGCLESLSTFVSGLVGNSMYAASVSFLPPLTFYVYAAATVIPAGTTLALQIFWPRRKEYVPLNINVAAE